MSKKKRAVFIVVWVALMVIVLVAALLVGGSGESESIKVVMRDAVLHGTNKVSLFGIKDVNPAYISSLIVCGALLVFAAVIRIFVIPKFKMVPGKFQMLLEQLVTFFDNLAKTSSPHKNSFLGAYVFAAGVYIFVGTLFELFGIQAATTAGGAISLPAPLSDINASLSIHHQDLTPCSLIMIFQKSCFLFPSSQHGSLFLSDPADQYIFCNSCSISSCDNGFPNRYP